MKERSLVRGCKEYETAQMIELVEITIGDGMRAAGREPDAVTQDAVPQDQYLIEKLMEPSAIKWSKKIEPDKDCRMVECCSEAKLSTEK